MRYILLYSKMQINKVEREKVRRLLGKISKKTIFLDSSRIIIKVDNESAKELKFKELRIGEYAFKTVKTSGTIAKLKRYSFSIHDHGKIHE